MVPTATPLPNPDLLSRVRDAWHVVQAADSQLVKAVAEAHLTGKYTYRNMADVIIRATGEPALTNEKRRRLANTLKERFGRARRATKHCGDLQRGARIPLPDGFHGHKNDREEQLNMTHYRRKVIETTEEWRDAAPSEVPPMPDELAEAELVGADDEDDDDDEDEEDGDDEDDEDEDD